MLEKTENPIREHNRPAAAMWGAGGRHYDEVSFAISDALAHAAQRLAPDVGADVLDIATGTGWTARNAARMGAVVTAIDIAEDLLTAAAELSIGTEPAIRYRLADAENLPFADNYFDCITIGFGLRNVTDKARALTSMRRVLKPGGRLCVLEFSKPIYAPLEKLYDFYSFRLLPCMGEAIARDRASYQYLAESIRRHPDQDELKRIMLEDGGFDEVEVHNMSGGIVALHRAFKY